MAKLSALTELLERNTELFSGKRVLFVGEILDESLLQLVRDTTRAALCVDHYAVAQQMSALFARDLPPAPPATVSYKQISILFTSREDALKELKTEAPFDTLCLLVHKSKAVSQALLHGFSVLLKDGATVAVAGANDGGGRSAHQLIKNCADVHKRDTARKCTLFCGTYHKENPFAPAAKLNELRLDLSVQDAHLTLNTDGESAHSLTLQQDVGVFSPSCLDKGTALLLASVALPEIKGKAVLDLCCGCGVVGIALAPYAKSVTYCDASAEALSLTQRNLHVLNLEGSVQAAKPDDRLSLTRWIPPSRIQDSVADSLRSVSLAQGFEPHRSGFVWRLQNRVFAVEPHRVALFLHRPDKLPPGQRTVDRIVHILSDEAAPG